MTKGKTQSYTIGGKSYTISDFLSFRGVHDVLSSRTTEGSKRELLRSMLRNNKVTPSMLTEKGVKPTGAYGSQRRRLGEPMRDKVGRITAAPRLTHDERYDGPYDPKEAPPGGRLLRAPPSSKKASTRKRTTMYVDGKKRSATEMLHLYPKLKRQLDKGKGLKQRTLEGKLRKAYKDGTLRLDHKKYEIYFDKSRDTENGIVRHFVVENPNRTSSVEEFMQGARERVVKHFGSNPENKASLTVRVLVFRKDDPKTLVERSLPIGQYEILELQDLEKTYSRMEEDVKHKFEVLTDVGSGWLLYEVTSMDVTLAELKRGRAGHYLPLPKFLRVKHALINMRTTCVLNGQLREHFFQ